MKYIPIIMELNDIAGRPHFELPAGYTYRFFRSGDEIVWAEIETSAGEFQTMDQALDHFYNEFGGFQEELKQRCLFICEIKGRPIGTAMAWFNASFRDRLYGRLHWVLESISRVDTWVNLW